jgi:hypothetical protein
VDWILSTRPNSQGTVTANTYPQLQSKTWPAILKWVRLAITSHCFECGVQKISVKAATESWFVIAQTCRRENSESFHGQPAARSTSWYLFDEAGAIPDEIWAAAEGGLTDGEPMIFAFGNPTRSSGQFHRIVFGSERDRWKQKIIDSRTPKFSNKNLIEEWSRITAKMRTSSVSAGSRRAPAHSSSSTRSASGRRSSVPPPVFRTIRSLRASTSPAAAACSTCR